MGSGLESQGCAPPTVEAKTYMGSLPRGVENPVEKKMEHETEAGIIEEFTGVRVSVFQLYPLLGGPFRKGHSIWGSILGGSPYDGNYQISCNITVRGSLHNSSVGYLQ